MASRVCSSADVATTPPAGDDPLPVGDVPSGASRMIMTRLRDGRLLPCPERPNCVSSGAVDPGHRIEALPLERGVEETSAALKSIVGALPRTELLAEEPGYLHFQITSLIFRWKDDLEFHLVPAERLVHLRAASRVGHYDFGINRARVEVVRRAYHIWLASPTSPIRNPRS